MRIDAHLHFWQPSCGFDNKPVANHEAYRRDFLPGDVKPSLVASGIDGAILVQTAPEVAETAWLLQVARDTPWILGITGWVDLDSEECDYGALIAEPKIVGIRAQLRRIADPAFVAQPRVVRNLGAALQAGLNVTILAERRHYGHVASVIDRLPAGPITLNHLGMLLPDAPRDEWRGAMQRFARRPGLHLQLSGLPFLFADRWREPDAHAVLDDALDIFGPERLMFASDWPMLLRFADYGEWVDAVEAFLARRALTGIEIAGIFGTNAMRANPRLAARVRGGDRLNGE